MEAATNSDALSIVSKYYLIPQVDVVTVGGLTAVVQYDSGSQTSSVSARFAKQQGIHGQMCDVKSLRGVVFCQFFEIPVIGTGGHVEDIPSNLKNVFFPGCESREWATWDGRSVDVVIGNTYTSDSS